MPNPLMPYGSDAYAALVAKTATVSKTRLLMPYGAEGNAQLTAKVADVGKRRQVPKLDANG